jgi:hypothetical protein
VAAQASGLERVHQYGSRPGLFKGEASLPRGQQTAFQPSGNGISGQATALSLAALGVRLGVFVIGK